MAEMTRTQIFRMILIALALVLLTCAAKNYLTFFLRGGPLCPLLCPSTFRWRALDEVFGLGHLFRLQEWLMVFSHAQIGQFIADPWNLFGKLALAPVVEEVIYRGPLYLTRSRSRSPGWWIAAGLLVLLFALSHGRVGVALLPLLVLGALSVWLVSRTGRLWPSVVLHFLNNFFFTSVLLYQAQWMSD